MKISKLCYTTLNRRKIMKALKFLFSRFSLIVFSFVINIVFLVLAIEKWGNYYKWISMLLIVFAVLAFFHMLRKNQPPEFKVLWLMIFMVFPLFGIVLYILIGNSHPPKRQIKAMENVAKQFAQKQGELNDKVEHKNLLGYDGIDDYLVNATNTFAYRADVKFFDLGEKYFESLVSDLKNAKNFIFMEYFIINYGKIWDGIYEILCQKVREGVDVRVVYDDIGCAGKLKSNFAKQLRKSGIKCEVFNPFLPFISGIYNNRDHRKIVVIDGEVAYTGGCNVSDEYANIMPKYGHWKDTAIRITGNSVNNFTMLFLQIYLACTKKNEDVSKFVVSDKNESGDAYVHAFATGPSPYSDQLVGENTFINMISMAKHKVYITSPYLIIDSTLTNILCITARKGVDVRIVTPHIPDKKIVFGMTRESYKQLLQAGVKIYEYTPGFIHAKQILVDDKVAFVGTINLDYRSLIHHFECGAVVFGGRAVDDIKSDFDNLFEVGQQQNSTTIKTNPIKRLVNLLLLTFRPLF